MKHQTHGISVLTALLAFLLLCAAGTGDAQQAPPAPAAGGVGASGPTFKVVRSISGSKGTVQGNRYVMDDPRSIFYIPRDKQVIVYFEWEGPTGTHKFEGYWKNPEGKLSAISDFSYEAKDKRFGAYWTLTLSDTMVTGVWTLEARVDGEATGNYTFQVLSGEKPAEATPVARMLSSAEIYKRAGDASVFIERLDTRGLKHGRGSGFFLGENIVATSFQVIDGASSLQITLSNGQRVEGTALVGWNRRQDWALVEVTAPSMQWLERAADGAGNVGDRVFLMDSPNELSRTIAETEVVGVQNYPGAGKRLSLAYAPSVVARGGPVVNEYGKLVGLVAGPLLPGASTLQGLPFNSSVEMLTLSGVVKGSLSVPIGMVSMRPPMKASLADMAKNGQFMTLLTESEDVLDGTLCKQVEHKDNYVRAVGRSNEFRRSDAAFYAVVSWNPKSKRKAMTTIQVFDIENRPLAQAPPGKVTLDASKVQTSDWKLPVSGLEPGIYRVDVLLDAQPAWRTFFKIVE